MSKHSNDNTPKLTWLPKRLCLLALLTCLAPVVMTACGEGDEQPVTLYVNRTLTANGFEISIGRVTFAPTYSWTSGSTVEHGQAVVVSLRITNVVGPASNNYANGNLYLLHPERPEGRPLTYPLKISNDLLYPGAFRELELVFPLDGSYTPDTLGSFALEMSGHAAGLYEATVFFNGDSAPDGTPVHVPAGLRMQGTIAFEVTRAELRTDYPCLHEQAFQGTHVLHIAATITVPETAPEDPEERKRLFYGLEAGTEAGEKLEILSGWCPPGTKDLFVTRPMVQQNVIFDLPNFQPSNQARIVTLRYAGAEGTIEIPATAP